MLNAPTRSKQVNDATAHALAAKYPHTDARYHAFYDGRGAAGWLVDVGGERPANPFTAPELRADWQRGFRQVMAEERLNNCTEWND
jgi:ribosome modulation factor